MKRFEFKNDNYYIEGDDRFYGFFLGDFCFVVYRWEDNTYGASNLIFDTDNIEEANKLITKYIEENPNV